jgi:hypothetical protein
MRMYKSMEGDDWISEEELTKQLNEIVFSRKTSINERVKLMTRLLESYDVDNPVSTDVLKDAGIPNIG